MKRFLVGIFVVILLSTAAFQPSGATQNHPFGKGTPAPSALIKRPFDVPDYIPIEVSPEDIYAGGEFTYTSPEPYYEDVVVEVEYEYQYQPTYEDVIVTTEGEPAPEYVVVGEDGYTYYYEPVAKSGVVTSIRGARVRLTTQRVQATTQVKIRSRVKGSKKPHKQSARGTLKVRKRFP